MKRTRSVLIAIGIVVAVFGIVQWERAMRRKAEALAYLDQYGAIGDWQFLGHRLGSKRSIPRWLPGVWPRDLVISAIPPDPARYAAAVRELPSLDTIMVLVYEPMSLDIFTALGAVPGAKGLDLDSLSVSDAALEKFTQFATVDALALGDSTITDAAIPHILKFRHMRTLYIGKNNLADSTVLKLAQLPALQTVFLDGGLSPETIAALRAKRPDLEIRQ